jgi:RNA polymerase sigma factor (sigma-70 family)
MVKEETTENDSMTNTEPVLTSAEAISAGGDTANAAGAPVLVAGPLPEAVADEADLEMVDVADEEIEDDGDEEIDGASPPSVPKSKSSNPARNDATIRMLFGRLHGPVENLRYGDRASLRDHLVLLHAPLVEHCARNFAASGEPVEDLVQEGYVGLIKAVDRFDPDKGVRFSTYACHLINGEIRHYLRDLGRLIHEPGWHFELRQRIARVNDQLTQQLSRPPEPEEIAKSLIIEPCTVREVLKNLNVLAVE